MVEVLRDGHLMGWPSVKQAWTISQRQNGRGLKYSATKAAQPLILPHF